MANNPEYRLSRLADNDLVNIAEYTIQEFGIKQARRYRDALENCFLTIAENPNIGFIAYKRFSSWLLAVLESRANLIRYVFFYYISIA